MIDPRQLTRTRDALRILRRLELAPDQWPMVTSLARELLRAVHARDEVRLRKALAALERGGVTRAGGLFWGERTTAPESVRAVTRPPDELFSGLADLEAELAAAAAEIRRVPHIDIDALLPLRPGTRFIATVRLDTTPPRSGEEVKAFVLRNPPAELQKLSIGVWLTATAHFVIEDPTTATIEVRPAEPRSSEAQFAVTVCDPVPADSETPALHATFDYHLRASGYVRRTVPVVGAEGEQERDESVAAESGGLESVDRVLGLAAGLEHAYDGLHDGSPWREIPRDRPGGSSREVLPMPHLNGGFRGGDTGQIMCRCIR